MIFYVREKPEQEIFPLGDPALGCGLKTMPLLILKGKFSP